MKLKLYTLEPLRRPPPDYTRPLGEPEPTKPSAPVHRSFAGIGERRLDWRLRELGGHENPPPTIFATLEGQVYELDRGEPEWDRDMGWAWPYRWPEGVRVVLYGKLEEPARACPRCESHARVIRLTALTDAPKASPTRCQGCGLVVGYARAWDPDQGATWRLLSDGSLGLQMSTGAPTEIMPEEEPTMTRRRETPIPDDTNGAPVRPPKPRTHTRKLDVVLSAEERDERQESLLTALSEGEDLAAEKSAAMADFRQRGKAQAARVVELRHAVTARIEKRDVKCEERFDDRRGEVQVVRLDTGAVIDTRPQTPEERQQVIPGTGPDTTEVREPGQKIVKVTRRKKRGQAALPSVEG